MAVMDDELGLLPGLHDLLRRLRGFLAERGVGPKGRAERPLDPMVVDNEAWRVMRRNTRRWPDYREAPNSYRVLVSKPDWDEYWGVDSERKADNVARYLLRQAADKDLWIAGTPRVSFAESDEVARGGVSISASFAQHLERAHKVTADEVPAPDEGIAPAASYGHGHGDPDTTMRFDRVAVHPVGASTSRSRAAADDTMAVPRQRQQPRPRVRPREEAWERQLASASPDETVVLPRATRLAQDDLDDTQASPRPTNASAKETGGLDEVLPLDVAIAAYLVDDKGFHMQVHPGDVIGAVREGGSVPDDVNVRLDGRGFPGVEARHLSLAATADGWTATDLAKEGTVIDGADGNTRTLGPDEVTVLSEGDVIHLGERPLRFEFAE